MHMDSPFFTTARPVQRRPSPKVVSIPVHFVGSEEPRTPPAPTLNPAQAARKIQKVVRGFLVRKSVKKIVSIRNEVNQIEKKISNVDVVELMRQDSKERLRVNEALMALLFRLDSVRGFDSGVRDLRKAVIRKAIALQETVDGLVNSNNNDSIAEMKEDSGFFCLIGSEIAENQMAGSGIGSEHVIEDGAVGDQRCVDEPASNLDETVDSLESVHNSSDQIEMALDAKADETESPRTEIGSDVKADEEEDFCTVKEIDKNGEIGKDVSFRLEEDIETGSTGHCEDVVYSKDLIEEMKGNDEWLDVKKIDEVNERDDDNSNNNNNNRNEELLEKMMEENIKMMRMMTQIFERNEEQMRMLNSLSHRVEQLEKAFSCDKVRRRQKKKRRSNQ